MKVNIQKLRLFAMLMRLKEIEESIVRTHREIVVVGSGSVDFSKGLDFKDIVEPLTLTDIESIGAKLSFVKDKVLMKDFNSLPQKNKHRKNIPYHS